MFASSKRNRILHSAFAAAVGALVVTAGAVAQTAPSSLQSITRVDLQRHDLGIAGREAIQVRVDLKPGAIAPRHSHPGEEIVYVLKGTLVYELDGQPPRTLKAGDVYSSPPVLPMPSAMSVTTRARNSRPTSSTRASRFSSWQNEAGYPSTVARVAHSRARDGR